MNEPDNALGVQNCIAVILAGNKSEIGLMDVSCTDVLKPMCEVRRKNYKKTSF
jgi:hypothetical protein